MRSRADGVAVVVVLVAMAYFAASWAWYLVLEQERFVSAAYDVGLFDQTIWLMSRGMAPISTIKGVNIFGDHASLHMLLVVPLMRAFDSIDVLYVWQSIVLALGALPMFMLARSILGSPAVATAVALAYLLHPALQNMAMENFHPETSVPVVLLCALWFFHRRRWGWYLAFCLLAAMGKEDVGLSVFVFGLYVAFVAGERKWGLFGATAGIGWYLVASRLLMPWALGTNASAEPMIFSAWFSSLGPELLQPWRLVGRIVEPASLLYYVKLLAPTGFLCLAAPVSFGLAVPAMLINAISGSFYLRSIDYHYNYVTLPFVFFAVVMGIHRLQGSCLAKVRASSFGYVVAGGLLGAAIAGNVAWSILPLQRQIADLRARRQWVSDSLLDAQREAVASIPDDASVSATYRLVPHLTHREQIYMFPNPFRLHYWNMWFQIGKNPMLPGADVDYVLVRTGRALLGENLDMAQYLAASGHYETAYAQGGIILLKRLAGVDDSHGLDYVVNTGGEVRRGRVSTLFFPESGRYLRGVFGEMVAEGPFEAAFAGYLDVTTPGIYGLRIATEGRGTLTIDATSRSFEGPTLERIDLPEGRHRLHLRLGADRPPYGLRVRLLSRDRREIDVRETELSPMDESQPAAASGGRP